MYCNLCGRGKGKLGRGRRDGAVLLDLRMCQDRAVWQGNPVIELSLGALGRLKVISPRVRSSGVAVWGKKFTSCCNS